MPGHRAPCSPGHPAAESVDSATSASEDALLVSKTAAEFVGWLGDDAPHHLRSRSEIAGGAGDALSEQAWLDIADAAERLIGQSRKRRL